MQTVKEMTEHYNAIADKNIKVGSYSKAQLTKMIDAIVETKLSRDRESNEFRVVDIAREFKLCPKQLRKKARDRADDLAPFAIGTHKFATKNRNNVMEILGVGA